MTNELFFWGKHNFASGYESQCQIELTGLSRFEVEFGEEKCMKILFDLSTCTVEDHKLKNHLHCIVVDINMPYPYLIAIPILFWYALLLTK